MGEPLLAEATIYASDNDEIAHACFSLAPAHNAELPVVSAARTRVLRNGEAFRLLITGGQPITEPVFIISLRASCGVELKRDYVLMPEAPLMQSGSKNNLPIAAVDPATEQKPLTDHGMLAHDKLAPAETTPPRSKARRMASNDGSAIPHPKKTVRLNTLAELGMKGGDRLMLSAEPDDLKPNESVNTQPGGLGEMDGRMLKLETSLHSLNQQVENLSAALAVSAETAALRQKLQEAQAQLAANNSDKQIEARSALPQTPEKSNSGLWIELLLSALVGGGISGATAYFLSHRTKHESHEARPTQRTKTREKTRRKG